MSIEEPTAIGTVVRISTGSLLVLAFDGDREERWMHTESRSWWLWSSIATYNPVIVHEGYTPPIPEPTGEGAVIRTRVGLVMHAIDAPGLRVWCYTDGDARLHWDELDQPVEVLFEGVEQ